MAPDFKKSTHLRKALARLTGDAQSGVNEGVRFRVRITTADGHDHAVNVQCDNHARDVRPYQLPQIARSLNMSVETLREALVSWEPEDLRAHLSQFTKDELRTRRQRH